MVAGLSTSPNTSNNGTGLDTGHRKRGICGDAVLKDYLNTLPADFEGDACPPLTDDNERMEHELAKLDRSGLTQRVASVTRRCNEALMELLEQEQQMGNRLSEVRYLESRLSDREDEVEMLRLQLQASDDHIEGLLREKADVLRMLTESKNELAHVSAKAASLQRDLNAKTKHENNLLSPLWSTPRAASVDVASPLPALMAQSLSEQRVHCGGNGSGNGESLQNGFALNRALRGEGASVSEVAGAVPPVASDLQRPASRQASSHVVGPSSAGVVQGIEAAQNEGVCLHSSNSENVDWRKRCLEYQKRNEFLEKELTKTQFSSSSASKELTLDSLNGEMSHAHVFVQELHSRLRRTMEKLGRVERELDAEREQNRKQGKLETQLLKDVALFARKLRNHENAESEMRAQRRLDMNLTREELLDELGRCRSTINELRARISAFGADEFAQQRQQVRNEASITEELASALEEALTANEVLRAEKEVALLEKKAQEETYEAELRSRVAEMERLTAALHELQEHVNVLGRRRSLDGGSQR
ncbi:hypothetical protein TraAM80_02392 [Trypanosoma rangeli]|uniref:Uncharacterized protein n=1 Tax=Trypanosoma rangeli TaxID=5698 RepID=A0A3R7L7G6_TRYRA|nr:uncharacterized protein TraAM80_02392 [Trypanosoma rangeli]RNF09133.1 hypothetical protein TraAM80_02392 [Trypanosoma rangeli]|eukprot:RNF09133.1 hypothetical protein TraAM80_02392 [Trypanosoma rangeli]